MLLPTRQLIPSFVILTIATWSVLTSCTPSTPLPRPRLVILYATCTVNADYLSPYNRAVSFTPNLERFAEASTVFTKHQTEAGQSGIAYASILTGTQAYHHGVYRHPKKIPEDRYLVAEAFADNAYETLFWSAHQMASSSLRYGQGVPPQNTFEKLLSEKDQEFLAILDRLKLDESRRAFIMTSFTTTHGPYGDAFLDAFLERYPEEGAGISEEEIERFNALYRQHRFQLQWNFPETIEKLGLSAPEVSKLADVVELLYKSRIAWLDHLFGKIVEQVRQAGLFDEALIVFTADHGEILYRENSHVKWEHGNVLLPDVLSVPLIIHAPALKSESQRWEKVTRSIDVLPTMLALSGMPMPAGEMIEGVDLTPALLGREEAPVLLAYSHTTAPIASPAFGKRRKAWTLQEHLFPGKDVDVMWTAIRDRDDFYRWRHFGDGKWDFEAFDLAQDPWATSNQFDRSNRKHREMARKLVEYKTRLLESFEEDSSGRPSSIEVERRLKSLGYLE